MRKQYSQVRLASIIREDSGDYSGEPSFQGGPLGFGGRQQLANPVVAPGLQDPAEKKYYPVVPSLYPVLFAQEQNPVSQLDESGVTGKKLLLLVHPDIVFEMSTESMQAYYKRVEDEVLGFDHVISHLFYSPDFKPEWLSRDGTHNHIFTNFMKMIRRNSNVVKWDNPRFSASFKEELPDYLIDNPGTTIYLAGGYKDLCVKATQEMMNDRLGSIVKDTGASVVCYKPLLIQSRDHDLRSLVKEYTRARGDILYKDLPGGPAMNTLDKPVDHVPHGEDPENKLDTDAYGVRHLIPNGRDDIDPGEQFMVDDLDDSNVNGLNLDKANIMASPNDYAVTSPEYRGKNIKDPPSTVFDQLVKPIDWIGMETGTDQPYLPGEINDQDFESRVMQMGNVVKPVVWVGNGDDRNNNNMDKPYLKPDYYLSELIMSKKDNSPAVTKPKPTGNGLGTVQKRFDDFPKKGKDDKTDPFADKTVKPMTSFAAKSTSSSTAATNDDDSTKRNSWDVANLSDVQVEVIQEMVIKSVIAKLQKLSQS